MCFGRKWGSRGGGALEWATWGKRERKAELAEENWSGTV
jgi:hypothetical protein